MVIVKEPVVVLTSACCRNQSSPKNGIIDIVDTGSTTTTPNVK